MARQAKNKKHRIFLTHYTPEGPVARRLKAFLEKIFARGIEVFVSSDELDLQPGDLWEKRIRGELTDSSMILVLLSSDSMIRPWVNFEAGTGWLRNIPLVPMVHRELSLEQLVRPFSSMEGVSLREPKHISTLVRRIGDEFDLDAVVTEHECATLAMEILSLDRQIDEEAARECSPRMARSAMRFYLYSKSQSQDRRNLEEVAGSPLSCFRKPHLHDVFSSLMEFGQPDACVVSIDEYWIQPLAQAGRLEDLSDFVRARGFFGELIPSSTYEGRHWSAPHFLDFGYYTSLVSRSGSLLPWLAGLTNGASLPAHLENLKRAMGTDRLLAYDFHTPDTCACVMLEFLEALGDGWRSLCSASTAGSERNLRALYVLRGMVGERPSADFLLGEPLDLDGECGTI
ncbi:MAG: TIR domain-containing protein, partial [Candidatus Eisenbacteria bacterium]